MKMAECSIRIIGGARLEPCEFSMAWVESYRDTPCGRGDLKVTRDPAKALRFPDAAKAMEFYRRQSKTRRWRSDGRPNRPLTAYSVEIVPCS